jgi:hypothetical protein
VPSSGGRVSYRSREVQNRFGSCQEITDYSGEKGLSYNSLHNNVMVASRSILSGPGGTSHETSIIFTSFPQLQRSKSTRISLGYGAALQ